MMDFQRNLSLYLEAHGWRAAREPGRAGRLWDHKGTDLSVAVPHRVEEGTLDWLSILERLAEVERVTVAEVEADLRLLSTDVANIRAANEFVISDTIPYQAGVAMVQNAWMMLRSCATTSMKVRPQIRSNYSRRGDEIAERARMAHTKRGSYIIPLLLPLSEPVQIDEGLVDSAPPEPPERRVMRTFAEALAAIETVVARPGREERASDVTDLVFSGVSAEFAAALHRVLTDESVAEFGATFQWAPLGGKEPEGLRAVNIPASAAPQVAMVAERLRKHTPKLETEVLLGPIVGALRDPAGGGVATIDTSRNSRSAHVSVHVSTDDRFDEVLDWMKRRTTMVVEGRISRHGADLFSDRKDGIHPRVTTELPQG